MAADSSRRNFNIMDLIYAANYIEQLEEKEINRVAVPTLKASDIVKAIAVPKKVLGDVTNTTRILPRFKSLLHGQIRRSITPEPFLTPKKRRRISFGKENAAPSPETPKYRGINPREQTESPPTPLSNLKLLTKIASAQSPIHSESNLSSFKSDSTQCSLQGCADNTEDETIFKKFFSEIPSIHGNNSLCEVPLKKHLSFEVKHMNAKQTKLPELSRKEKSLGVLVDKFLQHFPLDFPCILTPKKIAIDDVATMLSTERRRVYDIINILESLNMAERAHKNAYQWRGQTLLIYTLSCLKRIAVDAQVDSEKGTALFYPEEIKSQQSSSSSSDVVMTKKSKSLGVLCQKFVMLLLVSPAPHIVHLDAAINFLLGSNLDVSNKNRTKGRRIYDIANVLMSLNLVKRLPQSKSFQYIGPAIMASEENEEIFQNLSRSRHSLLSTPQFAFPDGIHIDNGRPSVEITTTSLSKNEGTLKAKRKCLMSAPTSTLSMNKELTPRSATQQLTFKIPPVDTQRLKARKLFEFRPSQIVAASKSRSVTFIHPNMDNVEHNTTPVTINNDRKKQRKENDLVNLRKPQFCTADFSGSKITKQTSGKAVPAMFMGNGLRSMSSVQIATNQAFNGSCSSPALVLNEPAPKISVSDERISLPSINFNTLSKNHYKTIIGPVPTEKQTLDSGFKLIIKNTAAKPVYTMRHNNQFFKVIHTITEKK